MHTASLRKVGESVMVSLPPALLEILHLRVGAEVGIVVEAGRLIIEPRSCPKYTLSELLTQCDMSESVNSPEDHAWISAPPVGRELL